jgi:myo-inositol catabolism protein IolC
MKQIGMLFKSEMIVALLENRKTMTRRLRGLYKVNENPDLWKVTGPYETKNSWYFTFTKVDTAIRNEIIRCPYGVRGISGKVAIRN